MWPSGDGVTDDTANFQKIITQNAGISIIYVDAGSYVLTDTIFVPAGAQIVGECWAQLVASGSKFQDMTNPHVLFRVGNRGDTGSVEIQDLLFTTTGPTAGLVAVEWNINGATAGSAAMWGEFPLIPSRSKISISLHLKADECVQTAMFALVVQ